MKIDWKWFSFAELIISVGILTIIAVFSLTSLSNNFEKQNLSHEVNQLGQTIDELESSLGKEITDYEIYLLSGSFYYYSVNQNYKNILQDIKFSGFTGTIRTTDTVKNDIDISFYFNDKKYISDTFSSTGSYLINLESPGRYRIDMYQTDIQLNKIYIEHYSQIDVKKTINLVEIKDANNNTYTGVVIKNSMWGKRKIETMTWIILQMPIEIQFEYHWIPLFLTLEW